MLLRASIAQHSSIVISCNFLLQVLHSQSNTHTARETPYAYHEGASGTAKLRFPETICSSSAGDTYIRASASR